MLSTANIVWRHFLSVFIDGYAKEVGKHYIKAEKDEDYEAAEILLELRGHIVTAKHKFYVLREQQNIKEQVAGIKGESLYE